MKKLFTLILIAGCCITSNATRRYVNIAATGLNNGTSWTNAWTDLAYVIHNNSNSGDTFWVANGTYAGTFFDPWAFHVHSNNVMMFGGFDGSETLLSQRNYSNHQTILLGGNSYNSIFVNTSGGRLDGFRITHSIASVGQTTYYGMQIGGNFVLANCLITDNWNVHPVLATAGGTVDIINCQFINNGPSFASTLPVRGSAIYCAGQTKVNITDCLFKNNQATHGGAIYQRDATLVTINRCSFYGNSASAFGGAFYDTLGAKLRVFNSLIVGNKAPVGGAHYAADSQGSAHNFTHCTIAGNWSSNAVSPNYALWLRHAGDTLRNCIIWGDSTGTGPEIASPLPGAVYSKNVIKGGASLSGTAGTYTFNPMFVSPGNAGAAPFPATSAYNYHLSALSEAIDTGANLALATPFNLDLDSNARAQGRLPDLGAHEWKSCPWLNVTITPSGPTTFCQPSSVTLTASANPLYPHIYQWNLGTQTGPAITVTASGVNKVVVVDSLGCRSAAGATVNAVTAPNPIITQASNTLSVPAIYATYQWYLDGNLISGATSASYSTTSYGNYTVRVTTLVGGCAGTSAVYNFRNLAVGGTALDEALRIYPNPGDGHFTISFDGRQMTGGVSITVTSVSGQQVLKRDYLNAGRSWNASLDLNNMPKGIYILKMTADGAVFSRRVIVE